MSTEQVVSRVQARFDSTEDLRADVVQETSVVSLGRSMTARGTVVFKRPGRMRWELEGDEKQTIVSDGETVWFYQPEDEQADRSSTSCQRGVACHRRAGVPARGGCIVAGVPLHLYHHEAGFRRGNRICCRRRQGGRSFACTSDVRTGLSSAGLLALLAALLALPVGATEGTKTQVVGGAPNELLLSITADGASTTLFEGGSLDGEQMAWSPDGSFAYVLAHRDPGLLVFDGERILRSVAIAHPEEVSFHPTRPLALVQGASYSSRAPLYIVDTQSHSIISELSVRRSGEPWVFTADGKWAAGSRGNLIDLEHLLVRDATFCDGAPDDNYARLRSLQAAELLVACRRYLARFQASTGFELDRVYFRDGLQGVGILPDGDTAMVVTLSGIARVRLEDLSIIEVLPFPPSIESWMDYDNAWFSEDGSVVELDDQDYLRTSDLSPIDFRWVEGLPIAPELAGRVRSYSWAWRESDRSYYRARQGVIRVDADSGERTSVVPDRTIRGTLFSSRQPYGYVLVGGLGEAQRVSLIDGPVGPQFQLLASGADHWSLKVAVAPNGGAIHYGVLEEPNSYRLEAIDFADHTLLGSMVLGADVLEDLAHRDEPSLIPLSRTRSLLVARYYRQYAIVDLAAGRVVHSGDYRGRFVDAAGDPAGSGAFLLYLAEVGDGDADLPLVQYVEPGRAPRDVWLGRRHLRPESLVVHPAGSELYVELAASRGRHQSLAVVDLATGSTLEEISFPSQIYDMALSSDGGQLVVALEDEPHLVVIDTASRTVLGSVPGAPRFGPLNLFLGGFGAGQLDADPLLAATPAAPDVVLFDNWLLRDGSAVTSRSIAVAGGSHLSHVSLRQEPDRYFSLSAARGGRFAYVADWKLAFPDEDYVDGTLTTIDVEAGTVAERPLDQSLGWVIADPSGEVAYSVAGDRSDRLIVSVFDLASGEILHSLAAEGKAPFRRLVLSPDGTYLVVSHDPLAILDTRDSRVISFALSLEQPPALTDDQVYFTLPDDRRWLWRMPIGEVGEPERVVQIGRDTAAIVSVTAAPDGQSVLVFGRDYNRFKNVFVVRHDGKTTEIAVDQSGWTVEGVAFSADGERIYVASRSFIEAFDVAGGVRTARIPTSEQSNHLVVGCAGSCPAGRPTPVRTPWRERGTLTPTPVQTPRPTIRRDYEWFEIDPIAARPGDVVELALRHRSTVELRRAIAIRHDLILPPVLKLDYTLDGTLDCEGWFTPWDRDNDPVVARFEVADDRCPALGGGCQRLSVIAASEWERDSGQVLYRCRARVSPHAALGTYPIESENLVVESWDPDLDPFVRSGEVTVSGAAGRPKFQPRTDAPAPRRRRQRVTTLRGSTPGGVPGEEVGVGFRLNSTNALPSGEFVGRIEIPEGLRLVVESTGYPRCGINFTNSYPYEFAAVPGECESGPCSILEVSMSLKTGGDRYYSEQALDWLQWFDLPIFECRYVIAPDAAVTQLPLVVRSAMLDSEVLDTEPGVVHVRLPESTATPSPTEIATSSPTATSGLMERPCEPLQAGRGILCVSAIEADPDEVVPLSIRFRSAGASYAGLEFVIPSEVLHIASAGGDPPGSERVACRVESAAGKDNTLFARSSGGAVKVLVISLSDLNPIPDDIVLIRCIATTSGNLLPGSHDIVLQAPEGSDPEGAPLPIDVQPGALRVPGGLPMTATATPQTGRRPIDAPARSASSSGCQIQRSGAVGIEVNAAWMFTLLMALARISRSRRPKH